MNTSCLVFELVLIVKQLVNTMEVANILSAPNARKTSAGYVSSLKIKTNGLVVVSIIFVDNRHLCKTSKINDDG